MIKNGKYGQNVEHETNDNVQVPVPPPYTAIIYKTDEDEINRIPSPNYSNIGVTYNGWRRINYTIHILNITLLLSSRRRHLFKLKGGA